MYPLHCEISDGCCIPIKTSKESWSVHGVVPPVDAYTYIVLLVVIGVPAANWVPVPPAPV